MKHFFLVTLLFSSALSTQIINFQDKSTFKLAYGSCNGWRNRTSDIFKQVLKDEPDIWLWLGDAAYSDRKLITRDLQGDPTRISLTQDEVNYIENRFNASKFDPYYTQLREQNKTKILGIWDDHDYGMGNGDVTFKGKDQVRKLYLNFIDEPNTSMRRNVSHQKGIWEDYLIQLSNNNTIHLVLIDVRSEFNTVSNDRLGDQQWAWLEETFLRNSNASLTIVASGIQMIPDRTLFLDEWEAFNKGKLFEIIRKVKKVNPKLAKMVLLSGDVHFSQFYFNPCHSETGGVKLIELTSSGMTHSAWTQLYCPASFIEMINPDHWTTDSTYRSPIVNEFNFGLLQYDTQNKQPDGAQLQMQIRGMDGQTKIERKVNLSEEGEAMGKRKMCNLLHQRHRKIIQAIHTIKLGISDFKSKRGLSLIWSVGFIAFLFSTIVSTLIRTLSFTASLIKRFT
ncbi:hypothetical protein FGO68_gene9981 [Halteria grandinella]|uniref:PhoD-like phosphatase metallophosphatase domain-containing protein n=1 Tax=Halteria grandinella TaxID=5974 RepID=A0A8J8NQV6_HALGN|nr:hypothetical protein FGO68_gene9981 [Halteria grandinella]